MKKGLIIFFLLLPTKLFSQSGDQFRYSLDNDIPLHAGELDYGMPWVGGINASQYNTMDINFDGKDDLVLYDRTAQKILTFLQVENQYVYAAEYETIFPTDVYNWLLIRDFNSDGLKDIFTGHIFGINVYKNVSTDTEVKWEHFSFYDGPGVSEVVLTKGLSGKINLQLQFDDLPSISDADGDGDLDIFTVNYGGTGTIEFHKNLSYEKYNILDSLDFEMVDNRWGGVTECECGKFVFNNDDCSSLPGRVKHAGGKSLLLLDGDGDGKKDMLITEGECTTLYMLKNEGTVSSPIVAEALPFPLTSEANFSSYPTGYFEDLDFDGIKDLMVTPNVYSKSSPAIEFDKSNWFYKNIGSDASPLFQLETKSFLQGQMLDVGDNAVPAFADFDGDRDFDLFVSRNCAGCGVKLFRNTGTSFDPSFELYDDDYVGLSSQLLTNMKIKFADIDADGKTDLVFQATPETGPTKIFFIRNKSLSSMDFSGPVESLAFSVAAAENISFVDVNNDGKQDILKGKSNGAIEYWRKHSSGEFVLETIQYLGIGANINSNNINLTSADLNRDGKSDLVLGDQTGRLRIVRDFRNASDISAALSDIVYSESTTNLYSPNLGGRIWPTTVDLYGNRFPAIVVGTALGGLRILRNLNNELNTSFIDVYPNPVHFQTENLTIGTEKDALMEVYSSTGQKIRPPVRLEAGRPLTFALHDFAAGMYILRFQIDKKFYNRRLLIH
jgi:hypothetical protein